MSPQDGMKSIDALASHVWMVRTFVKHSEEAEEDEDLMELVRIMYDFCLALGPSLSAGDAAGYMKIVGKKLPRLRQAAERFRELQPEVSGHTNFQMAVTSLSTAVAAIADVLGRVDAPPA